MATETAHEPVLRKLEELLARYGAIGEEMNRPEIASDPNRIVALAKEHGQLKRMIEPFNRYRQAAASVAESEAILADPDADAEFKALAQEELATNRRRADELMETMQKALVTGDDAAISSVILEIRAGTGGQEAALFARDLYEMYLRYCERQRFKVEVLDSSPSDLGGFKEVVLEVRGKGAFSRLKHESGVHRVQRVPVTESSGRIHTSTATVAVLPEAEDVDVEIRPEDLQIDVYRSSGPGGQSVNTTDSAVRITHKPTGIVVACQEERSQLQNREKALRYLRARLLHRAQEEAAAKEAAARRSQVGTGERAEKIRTYNFPENRVTDHRVKLTVHQLQSVLAGDIDEFVDALLSAERAAQLSGLDGSS